MIKLVFLVVGLLTLSAIVWHIGPGLILDTAHRLGSLALLIILLPTVVVYLLEAYGWFLTLGRPFCEKVGFNRLFAIRMAGEVINVTTPTGYVGGEPMKAYLLKKYGVPIVEGLASVVTAKTTMTLAQILFILVGLGLMFWILGVTEHDQIIIVISLGTLVFGVVLFIAAQRFGIAQGMLMLVRKLGLRISYLESREAQLVDLDRTIQNFYIHRRQTFFLAVGTYFLGWITETLEVYAILYFLGSDVDLLSSLSIAGVSVLIKGGTFFIPGSIGAQEGGYLLLLLGFGYDDVTGITFALIRRLREVFWIVLGLAFLAALRGNNSVPATS